MSEIQVGSKVKWEQSAYQLEGTVLSIVKIGESMFIALSNFGYAPRAHTKDIAQRGDRLIVLGTNGNHYTVLKCNVYLKKEKAGKS